MLSFYTSEDILSQNNLETDGLRHYLGANKHLLSALLLMLIAHIAIIASWKLDKLNEILPRTLYLKLMPVVKETLPWAKAKPEDAELPIGLEKIKLNPALEFNEPSLDKVIEAPIDNPSQATPDKNLYQNIITSIRKSRPVASKKHHTFGTADFPKKANNDDPFSAPSYIPVLVSARRTMSGTDPQGYSMIMKNDGFGNITCSQQRPGAGTEGPMWYRVPASMCGHLK